MKFFARLKRNSSIYQDWREHSRVSGFIDGIFFKLVGFDFFTERLEAEQIDKIKARQDKAIVLEMISIIPQPEETKRPRLKRSQ